MISSYTTLIINCTQELKDFDYSVYFFIDPIIYQPNCDVDYLILNYLNFLIEYYQVSFRKATLINYPLTFEWFKALYNGYYIEPTTINNIAIIFKRLSLAFPGFPITEDDAKYVIMQAQLIQNTEISRVLSEYLNAKQTNSSQAFDIIFEHDPYYSNLFNEIMKFWMKEFRRRRWHNMTYLGKFN